MTVHILVLVYTMTVHILVLDTMTLLTDSYSI